MANCVRHEGIGVEVEAKWPRRDSKFCTEACGALFGLEYATGAQTRMVVSKASGGALGYAKGLSTTRPPGDPSQPIPRAVPARVATADPADDADADADADSDSDGVVQGDGLDRMVKSDLRAECEALGLPVSGSKDDLIARIRDHHDAE